MCVQLSNNRELRDVSLQSLRILLLEDGANPCKCREVGGRFGGRGRRMWRKGKEDGEEGGGGCGGRGRRRWRKGRKIWRKGEKDVGKEEAEEEGGGRRGRGRRMWRKGEEDVDLVDVHV